MAYYFMKIVRFIITSFFIITGCIIAFFVTWNPGPLIFAIILALINFIIICAMHEKLKEFVKWLGNGFKTGEWH